MLAGFSIDFGTYSWPRPMLLDEKEAIRRFCVFEGDEQPPKEPINDNQLFNMLYQIKHCPCAKTECYDRMAKLYIMDKQRCLLKQLADGLL